jgi:hypothetical protein
LPVDDTVFAESSSKRNCGFGWPERLTLPYDYHAPPEISKLRNILFVTLLVPGEFCCPEIKSRLRRRRLSTPIVPMPETSVNEQRSTMLWKNEIRGARQIAPVQTKAKTQRMRRFADRKLWRRVPASHRPHAGASLGRTQRIDHQPPAERSKIDRTNLADWRSKFVTTPR